VSLVEENADILESEFNDECDVLRKAVAVYPSNDAVLVFALERFITGQENETILEGKLSYIPPPCMINN